MVVTTLMTKRSLRWLFQDCEVVHFNGGRIINLREEGKEREGEDLEEVEGQVDGFFLPTHVYT